MASLSGTQIRNTYSALLKTSDNSGLTSSLKTITDGEGATSALSLSSTTVQASALKITNVSETSTNTRFLTWDDTAKTVGYYDFSSSDPAVSVATDSNTSTVSIGSNSFAITAGSNIGLTSTGGTITISSTASTQNVSVTTSTITDGGRHTITDTSGTEHNIDIVGSNGVSVAFNESSGRYTLSRSDATTISTIGVSTTGGGTYTLSSANSGKIVYINTNNATIILPNASAGLNYTFFFAQNTSALTTVKILCAGSAVFEGRLYHINSFIEKEPVAYTFGTTAGDEYNTMNFRREATSGGLIGDSIRIIARDTSKWLVNGHISTDGDWSAYDSEYTSRPDYLSDVKTTVFTRTEAGGGPG